MEVQNFFNRIIVGDCWEWTGSLSKYGHGQFHPDGKYSMDHAHRYAYELLVGDIPQGGLLDHLCRNRKCVNPEHLEIVTAEENLNRGYHRLKLGYKYWCINRHILNKQNVGFTKDDRMYCIKCYNTDIEYVSNGDWGI